MIFPLDPKQRAAALYRIQNTYGERLRVFKREARPVIQSPRDTIVISPIAKKMLESSRRAKEERAPITYSNPRIENLGIKDSYLIEAVRA